MKPRYRKKGKYQDGSTKIVIEFEDGSIKTLPKPEVLLSVLKRTGKPTRNKSVKIRSLRDTKVHEGGKNEMV